MAGNKVNYGLKNVHFATITEGDGALTYGTPVRIPGAVSLSLEPRGDMVEFYADNMLYYSASSNDGYDGTLEIANIPEQFAIDALGEEKDTDDAVLTEKSDAKQKPFALLFEFDGDQKATRHVLYSCSASRPTVSGETTTNSKEPKPNELSFIASPRSTDYAVKTKTTAETKAGVYDAWYSKVYEKAVIPGP
ncbi:phage tail protein [Sporosarcina sp. NCCP-2716]|uniref:major tail protein n=1 Tax=Sporosarcina sp. NCCP-2716 TaxID=2943679 RepID=UPI0020419BF1|nr:major tail protein [Sporosarcina sp. NCCP-2716]GKV69855.1 phage tail protein [Sporosarcina sp. NCCP-2716]